MATAAQTPALQPFIQDLDSGSQYQEPIDLYGKRHASCAVSSWCAPVGASGWHDEAMLTCTRQHSGVSHARLQAMLVDVEGNTRACRVFINSPRRGSLSLGGSRCPTSLSNSGALLGEEGLAQPGEGLIPAHPGPHGLAADALPEEPGTHLADASPGIEATAVSHTALLQMQPKSPLPACEAALWRHPPSLPSLDLGQVKGCAANHLPPPLSPRDAAAPGADDDALCFEASCNRSVRLNAPVSDSRCYVYPPTSMQETAAMAALLARLPEADAARVAAVWEALLVARRDCEAMASRGVRVARDVSRDWQETVSDLIDRVVAQDAEIAGLKQQLAAAPAERSGSSEDLAAQVVRLKRQRDKLSRERQELSGALHESQEAAAAALAEAAQSREALASARSKARQLRQQHVALLRRHMGVLAHADALGAEAARVSVLTAAMPGAAPVPLSAYKGLLDGGSLTGSLHHSRRSSPHTAMRSPRSPASCAPTGSKPCGTPKEGALGQRISTPASAASGRASRQEEGCDSSDQFDRQFDQQVDKQLSHHVDQQLLMMAPPPPPLLQTPPGKPHRPRGNGPEVPSQGPNDYRATLEACRQQLEAVAALAL